MKALDGESPEDYPPGSGKAQEKLIGRGVRHPEHKVEAQAHDEQENASDVAAHKTILAVAVLVAFPYLIIVGVPRLQRTHHLGRAVDLAERGRR